MGTASFTPWCASESSAGTECDCWSKITWDTRVCVFFTWWAQDLSHFVNIIAHKNFLISWVHVLTFLGCLCGDQLERLWDLDVFVL